LVLVIGRTNELAEQAFNAHSSRIDLIDKSLGSPLPHVEDSLGQEYLRKHGIDFSKEVAAANNQVLIKRIIELIDSPEVQNNLELKVSLHARLRMLYSHKNSRDFNKSISHFQIAVKYANLDKMKFRNQLVFIYHWLSTILANQGKTQEATEIWKIIIDEYQGVGSGIYKDFLAANAVFEISRYAAKTPEDSRALKQYFKNLSEKYKTKEVGYAALTVLFDMSMNEGDQSAAKEYMRMIQQYPASSEYQRHSDPVLQKWERIEATKRKAEQ